MEGFTTTRALILDFDGVICQTETYKLDQMTAYFKEIGLYVEPKNLYRMAGGTFMDKEGALDSIFGGQPRYWEVRELAMSFHITPFPYSSLLTPGIVKTLQAVKSRGIALAVASNSPRDRIRLALEECGLLSYFDYTESPADSGRRKPDPYVYTCTMEKLGIRPEDCVVVEDSALGIQAGKAAGAKVIALKDRDGAINQSMADVIITRIEELLDYLHE